MRGGWSSRGGCWTGCSSILLPTASSMTRPTMRSGWSGPQDPTDNATPSGVSLAAEALTAYAAVTGSARHREAAEQALAATAGVGTRAPRFAGRSLAVAETLQSGPLEIAIVGDSRELVRTAFAAAPWGSAVVSGRPDGRVPLLTDRPLV